MRLNWFTHVVGRLLPTLGERPQLLNHVDLFLGWPDCFHYMADGFSQNRWSKRNQGQPQKSHFIISMIPCLLRWSALYCDRRLFKDMSCRK